MEFPQEESETLKKLRNNEKEESTTSPLVPDLGEDLIPEVLKLADAETLARAACVSRRWHEITTDERIWEAVCTRGRARLGCGAHQMRIVVNALGGYKKLHSVYLLPLLQPKCIAKRGIFGNSKEGEKRWGKDEVQLSSSSYRMARWNRSCMRAVANSYVMQQCLWSGGSEMVFNGSSLVE